MVPIDIHFNDLHLASSLLLVVISPRCDTTCDRHQLRTWHDTTNIDPKNKAKFQLNLEERERLCVTFQVNPTSLVIANAVDCGFDCECLVMKGKVGKKLPKKKNYLFWSEKKNINRIEK